LGSSLSFQVQEIRFCKWKFDWKSQV
jgi:hypothetical protein